MGDRVENVLRSAIRSWERWYWASGRGAMWGVGVGVGVSYGVIMFPRNSNGYSGFVSRLP